MDYTSRFLKCPICGDAPRTISSDGVYEVFHECSDRTGTFAFNGKHFSAIENAWNDQVVALEAVISDTDDRDRTLKNCPWCGLYPGQIYNNGNGYDISHDCLVFSNKLFVSGTWPDDVRKKWNTRAVSATDFSADVPIRVDMQRIRDALEQRSQIHRAKFTELETTAFVEHFGQFVKVLEAEFGKKRAAEFSAFYFDYYLQGD